MRVYSRDVPTSATNLIDLTGADIRHCSVVLLQAPEGNAATILFGDRKVQPFELRPSANASVPVNNAKAVFVKGTSGDRISIGFL